MFNSVFLVSWLNHDLFPTILTTCPHRNRHRKSQPRLVILPLAWPNVLPRSMVTEWCFLWLWDLPSGKPTKKLWKISMLSMGKSTISMAIFNSKLLVITRGYCWYHGSNGVFMVTRKVCWLGFEIPWLIDSMAILGTDWLEVPTIHKAYVRRYTPKIWPYMVQYLQFRILEFPLII